MKDKVEHCAICKKPLKDLEETICADCDELYHED